MPLAQMQYRIGAPRQRVWERLASSIVQSMPIEQMRIVNDTCFRGVLRMKLAGMEFALPIRVQAADISPEETLDALMTVKKGIVESNLKVSFVLEAAGEESTSVRCTVVEDKASPLMALLRGQQRRFAAEMFDNIRTELERSCR